MKKYSIGYPNFRWALNCVTDAYHRQLGELLDLLDCSWSTLLERYAMDLWVCKNS